MGRDAGEASIPNVFMGLGAALWVSIAAPALAEPDTATLEREIAGRLARVEEFRSLREKAQELGVRAWLFGGTAASYAHFVKWDLQRAAGDSRYQPQRFEHYDYYDIYRSTQDLDIVIDGTPAQAEALETALREKYPHMQGSKSAWEVRLLCQSRGDKEPIVGDDFQHQHTDSNSTGMILLNARGAEPVVSDARDWNGRPPRFLEDVRKGKLHFYRSARHETTARFKAGKNPEIFSVIRYLTKAFQYELEMDPADLEEIRAIIARFDPQKDPPGKEARAWLEKNAPKLFQHAVNLEYAARRLDELGLRDKLVALGDPAQAKSMAWWLSRQPLPSFAVGQGTGKTAAQLNLTTVAHETLDFLSLESITRAHTGDPNVLSSRYGAKGESASYGDGFYTAVGRKGAVGTGMTIRFQALPEAREGTDFKIVHGERDAQTGEPLPGTFVLWLNKAAFKVIPESLDLTPLDFFRVLCEGTEFEHGDSGLIAKLKSRIRRRLTANPQELSAIRELLRQELRRPEPRWQAFIEYAELDPDFIHTDLAPGMWGMVEDETTRWQVRRLYDATKSGAPLRDYLIRAMAGLLARNVELIHDEPSDKYPLRTWLAELYAVARQQGETLSPKTEAALKALRRRLGQHDFEAEEVRKWNEPLTHTITLLAAIDGDAELAELEPKLLRGLARFVDYSGARYFWSLRVFRRLSPKTLKALRWMATAHPHRNSRESAVRLLGELSPKRDADAVATLVTALADKEHQVREGALRALAQLEVDDPEVHTKMAGLLKAAERNERQIAAMAFQSLFPGEAVQIELAQLLADSESVVREQALKALVHAVPTSRKVYAELARALDAPVGEVFRSPGRLWRIDGDPRPLLEFLGETSAHWPEVSRQLETHAKSEIPEIAETATRALQALRLRPCQDAYDELGR